MLPHKNLFNTAVPYYFLSTSLKKNKQLKQNPTIHEENTLITFLTEPFRFFLLSLLHQQRLKLQLKTAAYF